MATQVERDMARAKDLRAQAKTVKSAVAKRDFEDAADRLEQKAAKGARKIGRRRRRTGTAALRQR